jgi:hypothetical protein
MKESLIKNKVLKEICVGSIDQVHYLKNEFHLVYKLLKLTQKKFLSVEVDYSDNIYLLSGDINLKLNYLKCFIDEIDHLFFIFHHFDLLIIFL